MGDGEYIVLKDGVLLKFTHWDDIPERFDNIIKFVPSIPDGPHTHQQHEEIETLTAKFLEFMGRENASRNKNR